MSTKKQLNEEHDKEIIDAWKKRANELRTPEELLAFINHLQGEYVHDYGTIIHAMHAVMMGAFRVMDRGPAGGITGFQASCLAWLPFKDLMGWEGPARIQKFEDLLYPQYGEKFEKVISKDSWEWVQKEAAKKLAEHPDFTGVAPAVLEHWRSIVAGTIPFGFKVKEG